VLPKIRKKEILNSEQLNSARLARWSQNGEARLTLEAASEWLSAIGFCPYLPLRTIPAPSFVEAVVGRPAPLPSAGERSRANELFVRLVENALAVPLKLSAALSEQPDFIANPETLRYIYALRGNRNFKGAPSTVGNDKVSPLALHCWQALEENGALDIAALQPILGRDMTEAAITRALHELWAALYVFPISTATGQPSRWDLLYRRFPQQAAGGSSTGHAEALSAMVSLYLHAAVAAPEEDVLSFLSALAAQSKLREVIRGLGSMRQLDIIDIGGHSHVCLQGGLLPEMVAQLSEEQLAVPSTNGEIEIERSPQPSASPNRPDRDRLDRDRAGERFVPKKFVPRKFVAKNLQAGEFASRRSDRQASEKRPGPGRASQFAPKRSSSDAPQRVNKFEAKESPGHGFQKRGFDSRGDARGFGERAKRWEKSGERTDRRNDRRPAGDRAFKPRGPFKSAGFQSPGAKPWAAKRDGVRDQSDRPRGPRPPFRSGPPAGAGGENERPDRWKKPGFGAKPKGGKSFARSFAGKPDRFRSAGSKSGGARPWRSEGAKTRGASSPYGAKSSEGPFRPYGAKTGGKPFGTKPWAGRSSFANRGAEDKPRRREKDDAPVGEKSSKPGAKPFWAKNPRGGKGSVAASRTNRPRGGKGGKKR